MSESVSSRPGSPSATGPLPIVIGVTGHRDLRPEDVPFLEGVVRATFVDLQDKYPHSPLVLLSPLAEGGDRLTARVAADMGIRLVVPLPLPRDTYVQDFETPESREEFERLLSRAESVIDMPLVDGNTPEGIRVQGDERNRQYAMVGAYIARHSQLFLALWDGIEAEADGSQAGGTADIVRFRLHGAPVPFDPPRSPLTFANNGPVLHIVTPRLRDPNVAGQAFTRRDLLPPHRSAQSFETLLQNMDRFNQDALALGGTLAKDIEQSKVYVLQESGEKLEHAVAALPRGARTVLEQYAVADALAGHFAQKTLGASKKLFVVVFASALCFNIFHSFPHAKAEVHGWLSAVLHMPWFLAAFVALFVYGSLVLHRRAAKGDYQNKYQDYRALAEGLRIQFFWSVASLPDSVVDHYLRKQRGELEWIRSALMSWDVVAHGEPRTRHRHAGHADRLQLVRKLWVLDQRNYFKKKAQHEHHALEKDEVLIERLLNLSFWLTAALAVMLIVPHLLHVHALEAVMHVIEIPAVHGTIMLVIVMLLVAAGLRHGYNQQLARSEHAKQFSRMSELFDIGERRLNELLEAGDHGQAEDLIKELGAEALEENGDWVLLHRERPLEVPHAG